jgi:thioredoxin 1
MTSEHIQELSDKDFETAISGSALPVMVDFWADWCPPCKILSPRVDNIAKQLSGQLVVGSVNVDQNPETAAKYNITGIPTLIFFKGGEVQEIIVGAVGEEDIISTFNKIK